MELDIPEMSVGTVAYGGLRVAGCLGALWAMVCVVGTLELVLGQPALCTQDL